MGIIFVPQVGAASPPASGITLVQSKFMVTNPFGTVHTWTPDSGITPGNTLIFGFYVFNTTLPVVSVVTNTAVALTLVDSYNTGSYTLYWYRLTNAGAGVTSVVYTLTGSNSGQAHGLELAGVTNTSPVDDTSSGDNGFETGPHDDIGATTSVANGAVFSLFRTDTRTLDTVPAGYTGLPASGTGESWVTYDLNVGAAGTYAPGINFTAGASSNVLAVALKAA